MIKISQNYEQLKILLEEALQEKKVVQKDFFQLNVKRTEVEENKRGKRKLRRGADGGIY